jgi:hypothetical protein
MTLETQGDKDVVVTRRFAASPEAVYRAHAEPRLIQKWLFGPDGADAPARPDAGQPCWIWFEQDATGTLMTMRMTLPDVETRAAMLATGMERGMEANQARLEAMI